MDRRPQQLHYTDLLVQERLACWGLRQLCGSEAWGADLTSGLRSKVRPGLSSHAIVPNQIRRIIAESRECRAGVSYSSS